MKYLSLLFLFLMGAMPSLWAQPTPFEVELKEISLANWAGIHSAAIGQHQGKWLVVGGRTNGLHSYLPPTAFPPHTQNTTLSVIDIASHQIWTADATTLADSMMEPITSSNMQFYQDGNTLYLVGGYGWSAAANDFITFPTLTAIDVPNVIQAIQAGTSLSPYFTQITRPEFAVTGANIEKLGNTFYLVFGHDFQGRYNHTSGATFTQTYTYEIRKFDISFNGGNLSIQNYQAIRDTNHFRRRDYNLIPQIFQDGTEGLTAFTGVFVRGHNFPYLNSIHIRPTSYQIDSSFQQKLNQYHSAHLPIYDSIHNAMHAVFFGGIGRFYPDSLNTNILVEDTLIPFVKTISRVTRYNNTYVESILPEAMPTYLGTNAQFLPLGSAYYKPSGILTLDRMDTTKTLVGHIIGGIESPFRNIFKGNESESFAATRIFEVWIHKSLQTDIVAATLETLELQALPNPTNREVNISFTLPEWIASEAFITNYAGQKVTTLLPYDVRQGNQQVVWNTLPYSSGLYFLHVRLRNTIQSFPLHVLK